MSSPIMSQTIANNLDITQEVLTRKTKFLEMSEIHFQRRRLQFDQKKYLHSSRCRATSFSATSFRKDSDVVMLQLSKVLVPLCIHGHLSSIWTFALVFRHVQNLKIPHTFKLRKAQNLTILIIMVFAAPKYSCNN